ncbi:ApeA N-terminal domain 1-containing protein, partial [Streptomyces decoyicus]
MPDRLEKASWFSASPKDVIPGRTSLANNPLNLDEVGEWSGVWWLPDDPDQPIPGVLRYSPEDGLVLSLIGAFEDRITSTPSPGLTVVHEGSRNWDVIQHVRVLGGTDLLGEAGLDTPVHVGVAPRVAPAQVGFEDFTDDVVWIPPERARLDERQPPRPEEQRRRVLARLRRVQHVLRGHVRVRADLQGMPVRRAGHFTDELVEQGGQHIMGRRPARAGGAVTDRH